MPIKGPYTKVAVLAPVELDGSFRSFKDITRSVDVHYKHNIDTDKWTLLVKTDVNVTGHVSIS